MFVNRKLKTIYLAHAGTASRATTNALGLSFQETAGWHCPIPDDYPWDPDTWEVVTTVRYHADWLVSRWASRFPGQRFEPARMDDHLRRMNKRIYHNYEQVLFPHAEIATRIMHLETINDDLEAWMGIRLESRIGQTDRSKGLLTWDRAMEYARSRFPVEMHELGFGPAPECCSKCGHLLGDAWT